MSSSDESHKVNIRRKLSTQETLAQLLRGWVGGCVGIHACVHVCVPFQVLLFAQNSWPFGYQGSLNIIHCHFFFQTLGHIGSRQVNLKSKT